MSIASVDIDRVFPEIRPPLPFPKVIDIFIVFLGCVAGWGLLDGIVFCSVDADLRAEEWQMTVGYAVFMAASTVLILLSRYMTHDIDVCGETKDTKKRLLPLGKTVDIVLGFCVVVSLWGVIDYIIEVAAYSEGRFVNVKITIGYIVATAISFFLWMLRRHACGSRILLRESFAMFQ